MDIRQYRSFPRAAVAATRRSSLAAPVALAIATFVSRISPNDAAARKKRKNKKKKSTGGESPCPAQVEECTTVLTQKCSQQVDPEQCEAVFLFCCDFLADCNAAAALECLLKDV